EAIAAWRGYLAKYPSGPHTAGAQRAILEAELRSAAEHQSHRRFADARTIWQDYVARNPLDPNVPEILFLIGRSLRDEGKADEAIAAWETLSGRFPDSESTAHAQVEIAAVVETVKGDPASAIERLKKIATPPWNGWALARIA